jgi:hypothetical protein
MRNARAKLKLVGELYQLDLSAVTRKGGQYE